MKKVTPQEFIDYLNTKASPLLKNQLENYDLEMVLGDFEDLDDIYYIHEGDLTLGEDWQPEAVNLIVTGSIISPGFINMEPLDERVDEGGSLWVLGNVECQHFANFYGKTVFVDGNMSVSGIVVNAFADAALVVIQDFGCHYFYGIDIWVEAGGKIRIEYGEGYGLPIGYTDAEEQAVVPKHDKETSLALLNLPDGREQDSLVERIKDHEAFFEK